MDRLTQYEFSTKGKQMNQSAKQFFTILSSLLMVLLVHNTAWPSKVNKEIFLLKTSPKSMTQIVDSVKSFVKKEHWVYLGDFKVKNDEVVLVKFCVKSAGKLAWKAGLKVSAMLPCGNMGVYRKNGMTEVSLLNPNYMTVLYPNSNLQSAADLLTPLYKRMMSAIVK